MPQRERREQPTEAGRNLPEFGLQVPGRYQELARGSLVPDRSKLWPPYFG